MNKDARVTLYGNFAISTTMFGVGLVCGCWLLQYAAIGLLAGGFALAMGLDYFLPADPHPDG